MPGSALSSRELEKEIERAIRSEGPIPFSRFMELALYHPVHGYYSRSADRIGPRGDYVTASDAGTAFGECLARQLEEMDDRLGSPPSFAVVEFGAGRGLISRDILEELRARRSPLLGRLDYVLVDSSYKMRERAEREAPEARAVAPEQIGPSAAGCVLAVELFDSLPVDRVRRRAGRLVEVRVGLDGHGRFVEVEVEPSAEVAAWASRYGVAAREGFEGEVSLRLAPQLDRMAATIGAGFLLIVDYGDEAASLYGPRRRTGTLLAYRRHRTSEDLLANVGEQDLTSHVNFTALEDRAREIGLVFLGRTTQERFLIANGILSCFEQDEPTWRTPSGVRRRLRALELIHPEGMGQIFQVLAFSKGIEPPPRLKAFEEGP